MSRAAPELSAPVEIDALPKEGRSIEIVADADECAAVAARLGVPAVEALRGRLAISANRKKIMVAGAVAARLKRVCVASLEEMIEEVDEPFEIEFLRHGEERADAEEEISIEDAPEIHTDPVLDLGEVLVQQLALAMAAYPRKDGAASLVEEFGGAGEVSPLAEALGEALKGKSDQ